MTKMSTEAKQKLAEFNAAQSDWYGVCRKCGASLRGTIKELKAHKCQEAKK